MPPTAPSTLVVAPTRDLDRPRIDTSTVRPDRLAVDATTPAAATPPCPEEVTVTDANPATLLRVVPVEAAT